MPPWREYTQAPTTIVSIHAPVMVYVCRLEQRLANRQRVRFVAVHTVRVSTPLAVNQSNWVKLHAATVTVIDHGLVPPVT